MRCEISIQGNIELAREVKGLLEVGGDGVGLSYGIPVSHFIPCPDGREHLQQYRKALNDDGRTLTIRTFDWVPTRLGWWA